MAQRKIPCIRGLNDKVGRVESSKAHPICFNPKVPDLKVSWLVGSRNANPNQAELNRDKKMQLDLYDFYYNYFVKNWYNLT